MTPAHVHMKSIPPCVFGNKRSNPPCKKVVVGEELEHGCGKVRRGAMETVKRGKSFFFGRLMIVDVVDVVLKTVSCHINWLDVGGQTGRFEVEGY